MFFLPFFLFQIFCVNIQDLKFSYVTYFYVDLTQHNSFIFFDVFLFIKKFEKKLLEKQLEKKHWKKNIRKKYWKKILEKYLKKKYWKN